jgi:sulfate adenylyltransferase large subunit
MATGASTADAAVVLIDASKGVLIQSRRHAYIASLLRVRHVIVAVNKMDLIGYDEAAFRAIDADFTAVLGQIAEDTGSPVEATFVPVSALAGDNIVHRSNAMPWYDGPSLLELLESLPSSLDTRTAPFRFPVQRVLRPDRTFRGFAGQIASGTVAPGDKITVLPSGRSAEVARIVTFDGDLAEAYAPLSVTLVLDRELDISRGDLIVSAQAPATVAKHLKAALVWMDSRPLQRNRRYLFKHTSQTVPAFVSAIEHRTNIATLAHEEASTLEMNAIGVVDIDLPRPIALDLYGENRSTGAFILIDAETNGTVAAGMITSASAAAASTSGPVTAEERAARWGHRGGILELTGPVELMDRIERSLFARGAITARIDADAAIFAIHPGMVEILIASKMLAGMIVLVVNLTGGETLTVLAEGEEITLDANDPAQAIAGVYELLGRSGIFASTGNADWVI